MAFRFLALLGLALSFALPAAAQDTELSAADRSEIQKTIQSQVDAFRRDDGAAAFGFASPDIQGMFGSADIFMDMVRQGYQPVYRPKSFAFRDIVTLNGEPAQRVSVVGPDGRSVSAVYPMTHLPDGTWRIDGCFFLPSDEHQV
jgi:hypothetical protein